MKSLAKISAWFVALGIFIFLSVQFAGPSISIVKILYSVMPILSWLIAIWLLAFIGLIIYLFLSKTVRTKVISFLTGIFLETKDKESNVNALKMSFSWIMITMLLLSFFAFIRVNVYSGYECRKAGNDIPCAVKRGTMRNIYLPGVGIPGSTESSRTLNEAGMSYFIANTPPVGGKTAANIAFLTLLFIAISRISIIFSKRRASSKKGSN
jgi:hypothetical protein